MKKKWKKNCIFPMADPKTSNLVKHPCSGSQHAVLVEFVDYRQSPIGNRLVRFNKKEDAADCDWEDSASHAGVPTGSRKAETT